MRELLNIVKRAVIMADGNRVTADDLGLPRAAAPARRRRQPLDLRSVREKAEREAVVAALARANGNIVQGVRDCSASAGRRSTT